MSGVQSDFETRPAKRLMFFGNHNFVLAARKLAVIGLCFYGRGVTIVFHLRKRFDRFMTFSRCCRSSWPSFAAVACVFDLDSLIAGQDMCWDLVASA